MATSEDRPGFWSRTFERQAVAAATPAPGASGGFDVQPSHLYLTSLAVRDEQFSFDSGAKDLVDGVSEYTQAAGKGAGAEAFADAYEKVTKRFLQVWAKSVMSVGGAAVGFTTTANNYVAANHASNPKAKGAPPQREPPEVIDRLPAYGPLADIKWKGTNADSDSEFVRDIGQFPDWIADQVEEAIAVVLKTGRCYEITPGAKEDDLRAIAGQWRALSKSATSIARGLNDAISYITDSGNSEWQGAMRMFCQSIFGTTAWGKAQHGHDWRHAKSGSAAGRQPITAILSKTALAVEEACEDVARAIVKTRGITSGVAKDAAWKTVKDIGSDPKKWIGVANPVGTTAEIVMIFRSHMDEPKINRAIDDYHAACNLAGNTLLKHMEALDEAYLSAPTYRAEAARSQAFGSRALNEFKKKQTWNLPEDKKSHRYPIDLASQEWMNNSHSVDKHVGKTDEQLVQRLRDQNHDNSTPTWPLGKPIPSAASTFESMQSAQQLTQYNLDQKSSEIEAWLKGPPPPAQGDNEAFSGTAPPGQDSGRTVTRDDFKSDGLKAQAHTVQGVKTVLKYDSSLDPPFVVLTSMPE